MRQPGDLVVCLGSLSSQVRGFFAAAQQNDKAAPLFSMLLRSVPFPF